MEVLELPVIWLTENFSPRSRIAPPACGRETVGGWKKVESWPEESLTASDFWTRGARESPSPFSLASPLEAAEKVEDAELGNLILLASIVVSKRGHCRTDDKLSRS
jgi:hypothetical protein